MELKMTKDEVAAALRHYFNMVHKLNFRECSWGLGEEGRTILTLHGGKVRDDERRED